MLDQFYTSPVTLARLQAGALGPYLDAFATLLWERGYSRSTIRCQLRIVGDLSHWLANRGVKVKDLDEEKILESIKESPRNRDFLGNYKAVFKTLLEHLRGLGLVSEPEMKPDESAIGLLLDDFGKYLAQERGLSQATLENYLPSIRRFLSERSGDDGPLRLGELSLVEVSQFALLCVRKTSHHHTKLVVTALRVFFRFLRLRGHIATDLAEAVPTVAQWRLSILPKSLQPEEVSRLLESCDQSSAVGQRDYAILLLVARLGLRAGEVVALRLDDFAWKTGEFTVRGKGLRRERLPIPKDVGEALATYLRQGRPSCSSRRVFVRSRAPHRGFASSVAICSIMRRALVRAGLDPARKGAHLLRHSLATEMLRKGASLAEIGQILRHKNPSTTEIYTKVDLTALHEIAQPWPGGEG